MNWEEFFKLDKRKISLHILFSLSSCIIFMYYNMSCSGVCTPFFEFLSPIILSLCFSYAIVWYYDKTESYFLKPEYRKMILSFIFMFGPNFIGNVIILNFPITSSIIDYLVSFAFLPSLLLSWGEGMILGSFIDLEFVEILFFFIDALWCYLISSFIFWIFNKVRKKK